MRESKAQSNCAKQQKMIHIQFGLCAMLSVFLLSLTLASISAVGQNDYSEDITNVRSQIQKLETETAEIETQRDRLQAKLTALGQEISATEKRQRNVTDSLAQQGQSKQHSARVKNLASLEFEQRVAAFRSTMPTYLKLASHNNMVMALRDNDINRLSRSRAYLQYLTRSQSTRLHDLFSSLENQTHDPSSIANLVFKPAEIKRQLATMKETRNKVIQQIDALNEQLSRQSANIGTLRERQSELTRQLSSARMNATVESTGTRQVKLIPPIEAPISRRFGEPKKAYGQLWNGILYQAESGQNVQASATGVVKFANQHKTLGLLIIIDHGNSLQSLYAHNSRSEVKLGDLVVARQTIARVGDSGNVEMPSLYFEVRKNGSPVDPLQWMDG